MVQIPPHPIEDARRYMDNARTILSEKAGKDGNLYTDKKYVRMAGNIMYNGIFVALDALLGKKNKDRKSVEWYQEELGKIDRKALARFDTLYETLHLVLGYDGNLLVPISRGALKESSVFIDWVDNKLKVVHA